MVLGFAEVQANPELVKGIEHEIELLAKKNGSKKPTTNQLIAEKIAEAVPAVLNTKGMTATEVGNALQSQFPETTLTPQRMSGILNKIAEANPAVERFVDKRRVLYKKVED